jgi:hypothetical protein
MICSALWITVSRFMQLSTSETLCESMDTAIGILQSRNDLACQKVLPGDNP